MKKLITAMMLVGCICWLSDPARSESMPQTRAKEMTTGAVSCQSGICVHFDKDNYAPYVEVRVESETFRVYKTGKIVQKMTKKELLSGTDGNPSEWHDGPYWTDINMRWNMKYR